MKRHIHTVHLGNKDFKCDSCSKCFASLQYLETHLHTIHDGYRDYKCEYCGYLFTQKSSLTSHIKKSCLMNTTK